MVLEHKCPLCGGIMNFNPAKAKLVCEYCDSEFSPEEVEDKLKDPNAAKGMSDEELKNAQSGMTDLNSAGIFGDSAVEYEGVENSTFSEEDADNMVQFCCEACGAVLVTDKNIASTTCSYCDSPMIIGARLSGELAPDIIIPFKFDKKAATEKFNKWKAKGMFHPREFKQATKVKELKGQYVPFWFYDLNSTGEIEAIGTKVRTYTRGDYRYTETSYFDVGRRFNLTFNDLPADASERMDDKVMDMLEPFDKKDFVPFSTPYLTGFVAEKYDYNDKALFKRIHERASKYTTDYIRDTCKHYNSIKINRSNINITPNRTRYALLPIWFFNYKYKGEMYSFTMNGQTGKVIGKPPISKPKVVGFFLASTGVITVALNLLSRLIGGVL